MSIYREPLAAVPAWRRTLDVLWPGLREFAWWRKGIGGSWVRLVYPLVLGCPERWRSERLDAPESAVCSSVAIETYAPKKLTP